MNPAPRLLRSAAWLAVIGWGTAVAEIAQVWVNSGEDKVAQEELRAAAGEDVTNALWDGQQITLSAARGETVACCVILEAPRAAAAGVTLEMSPLVGPGGAAIASSPAPNQPLWDFRRRPIELFYVRYLPLRGLSVLAYEHYDERHVPKRLRRPRNWWGKTTGGWTDRPDHDRSYPEIAVPLELHAPFTIEQGKSQCIWVDLFVPPNSPPGEYKGEVVIRERASKDRRLPIRLEVYPFALPETPSAGAMLYVSTENIARRYTGEPYPHDGGDPRAAKLAREVTDRHFQLAHRHRVALIHEHTELSRATDLWKDRLSGQLFTAGMGYEGAGLGVGNGVMAVGAYGGWPWRGQGRTAMNERSNAWIEWLDSLQITPTPEMFLYLIDESDQFDEIETWSRWVRDNPGTGHRLLTMATLNAPDAVRRTPSLAVTCSTVALGQTDRWQTAVRSIQQDASKRFWLYNGGRPGTGCFATEDDGVSPRMLGWAQYKAGASRWFVWEGTYYNNYQGGAGETNVFQDAHTFGGSDRFDQSLGQTGWNYNNGDGVLFYPGIDRAYRAESYDKPMPFASLRLKLWRRGLQDHEYLTLAAKHDPVAVRRLVERMTPQVLWEVGVDDTNDPTWVRTDISWSTNPDDWEAARRELAAIIHSDEPDLTKAGGP